MKRNKSKILETGCSSVFERFLLWTEPLFGTSTKKTKNKNNQLTNYKTNKTVTKQQHKHPSVIYKSSRNDFQDFSCGNGMFFHIFNKITNNASWPFVLNLKIIYIHLHCIIISKAFIC